MIDTTRAQYLLEKNIIEDNRKNPLLLQISGNAYHIIKQQERGIEKADYKYLKINVEGAGMQSFNNALFYSIIVGTVIFFFPLFLFFSNCVKRKMYVLFNINPSVYESIAKIMRIISPLECYIVVNDSFFDQGKANLIKQSLKDCKTQKFQFINLSQGLDTSGTNFTDFSTYTRSEQGKKRWHWRWGSKSN